MAMGQRNRREAENAIASCRPFRNSTGSMKGTRGSTRTLGWLEGHADARHIRELLSRAVYVVWSYETPIAFVSEDEEGNRTAYYVDETHTATTSNHQGIARMGMGEYETIGTEVRRERERENRRRAARVRAMQTGQARAEHWLRVVGQAEVERVLDRAEGGYTPAELRAEGDWMPGVDSPGYPNGLTEQQQADRLASLLDPRFADPDWTPFGDRFHGNLPEGAEARDLERVNREERTMDRGWTP